MTVFHKAQIMSLTRLPGVLKEITIFYIVVLIEYAIFKCLLFSVNAYEYLFKITNYYHEVNAKFLVILVLSIK